ncbi:hypothetical protein AVEN_93865-1 [Araneus ventricosus]|uniref:Uncharacterized protein n=1 Tax=Araneus ventricosus TaxID=182803 RepID=A0A4Y2AY74_ARAVE|nr:hypothetical protein AVEN_93865-1 [Araneus ventricosus]
MAGLVAWAGDDNFGTEHSTRDIIVATRAFRTPVPRLWQPDRDSWLQDRRVRGSIPDSSKDQPRVDRL